MSRVHPRVRPEDLAHADTLTPYFASLDLADRARAVRDRISILIYERDAERYAHRGRLTDDAIALGVQITELRTTHADLVLAVRAEEGHDMATLDAQGRPAGNWQTVPLRPIPRTWDEQATAWQLYLDRHAPDELLRGA